MMEVLRAHPVLTGLGVLLVLMLLIGIRDVLQRRHAILHNFPVVGHLRYIIETIGPELRQYLVAGDKEEQPFNRDERRWVYATSKGQNNNFGFGTTEQLYGLGYPIIKHAAFPTPEDPSHGKAHAVPCLKLMGGARGRRRPYRPQSVVNISAMSYGSLGKNAISALNRGAAEAHCYHNSGEGGVSPYHLLGGDVMWQLGTGYFGARAEDGGFSISRFRETAEAHPRGPSPAREAFCRAPK